MSRVPCAAIKVRPSIISVTAASGKCPPFLRESVVKSEGGTLSTEARTPLPLPSSPWHAPQLDRYSIFPAMTSSAWQGVITANKLDMIASHFIEVIGAAIVSRQNYIIAAAKGNFKVNKPATYDLGDVCCNCCGSSGARPLIAIVDMTKRAVMRLSGISTFENPRRRPGSRADPPGSKTHACSGASRKTVL